MLLGEIVVRRELLALARRRASGSHRWASRRADANTTALSFCPFLPSKRNTSTSFGRLIAPSITTGNVIGCGAKAVVAFLLGDHGPRRLDQDRVRLRLAGRCDDDDCDRFAARLSVELQFDLDLRVADFLRDFYRERSPFPCQVFLLTSRNAKDFYLRRIVELVAAKREFGALAWCGAERDREDDLRL